MSEGTRISPFAPFNPFQVRSRAIRTTNMGVSGNVVNAFADFTTTNTTDWQDIGSRAYDFPSQRLLVLAFVVLHVKHSVANATYGVRVNIHLPTDGSAGSNATFGLIDNLILPATANNWQLVTPPFFLDFTINSATVQPGKHLVVYQVRNYTAGTLSAGQANASDNASVLLFGAV